MQPKMKLVSKKQEIQFPSVLAEELAEMQFPVETFEEGRDVYFRGQVAEALYIVLSGSLTEIAEDDAGHELIIGTHRPGSIVGLEVVSARRDLASKRRSTMIARLRATVLVICASRLKSAIAEHPSLSAEIIRQMSSNIEHLTSKTTDLAFQDVKGRILSAINHLADQPDAMTHPQGVQIRIKKQVLGVMAACSREMAGRALKQIMADGLIDVKGKSIVLFRERPITSAADLRLIKA